MIVGMAGIMGIGVVRVVHGEHGHFRTRDRRRSNTI